MSSDAAAVGSAPRSACSKLESFPPRSLLVLAFRPHQKVIPRSCGVTSGLHGCCQYLELLFGPDPQPIKLRPGHSGKSPGGHSTVPLGHS